MPKLLIIDDDASVLAALSLLVKREPIEALFAQTPKDALNLTKQQVFDVVLMDMNYTADTTSGEEGLTLIEALRANNEAVSIIVMTGWATIDLAVKSMQLGANDFIEKPWDNARLLSILHTQIALSQEKHKGLKLSSQNKILEAQLHPNQSNLVAQSTAMRQLLATVDKIAARPISVFISGENGTGKSHLARHIHTLAAASDTPFISVNLGAVPESLFESELFGHVKGAFTDAKTNRIGRFELAQNGTLFLDEVGNTPLTQQTKLLRVLEERQFEKVGSSVTQESNARIISASNSDIPKLIADDQFREDLFFRLNAIELRLPSLKERLDDILPLTEQRIKTLCAQYNMPTVTLGRCAEKALLSYHWPGNVRELNHVLERSLLFAEGGKILAEHLMLTNASEMAATTNQGFDDWTLEQIEHHILKQRIQQNPGNMSAVASSLGLSRSAFYRRLEKFGL